MKWPGQSGSFSKNGLSRDKKTVNCSSVQFVGNTFMGNRKSLLLFVKILFRGSLSDKLSNCSPKELDSVAPINNLALRCACSPGR